MPQYVDSPLDGDCLTFSLSNDDGGLWMDGWMDSVLDPTLKLAYMRKHWDTEYYKHAEATIERVVRLVLFFWSMCMASGVADSSFQYDSYWIPSSSSGSVATSTAQADLDLCPPIYGMNWMQHSIDEGVETEVKLINPRQELHDYLDSPRVEVHDRMLDVIAWWGVSPCCHRARLCQC
jgi:hypothetical protein